ncbi:uncharacterized protein [Nicotiana tomentosiformis]|uniref:uncharacterized protein n=1 Tax=Nicotiana tomentosiformis TaxID=4098 RepID=UPI00388CA859
MSSPWPFSAWGIDVIGPIEPDASNRHRIKHRNPIAYRPQMNGAVEAANKNIKKILRKMVDNYMQWNEKLPFALLGYRTTVRTSTGATPYLLIYGTEDVIPAKLEIPSLKIIQEVELSDVGWVRSRQFTSGQLVLKRIFPHQDEAKEKFSPNWQGPYMVHRLLTGGVRILAEMDGEI